MCMSFLGEEGVFTNRGTTFVGIADKKLPRRRWQSRKEGLY
jgi:hypothetical protein